MPEFSRAELIKAVTCTINLGDSSLDAYMLPDGEKRLGVENIGLALGYSKSFFYQRIKSQSKSLEALRSMGFSGEQRSVEIVSLGGDKRESFYSRTTSLRDFVKLVTYEAIYKRNKKAVILLAAFAETGIERVLEDAFQGRSVDFILEKIIHYSKWTYEELEEVLAYNRDEARALYGVVPPSLQDG